MQIIRLPPGNKMGNKAALYLLIGNVVGMVWR